MYFAQYDDNFIRILRWARFLKFIWVEWQKYYKKKLAFISKEAYLMMVIY
jgi:hypothetical protein